MKVISADALKVDIDRTLGPHPFCNAIYDIIDNALAIRNEYMRGYEAAEREYKRPQGEWIWLGDNPYSKHKWSCDHCGHGVEAQENFCSNCGVDMGRYSND